MFHVKQGQQMTIEEFLNLNPHIGTLNRNGKTVYYVTAPTYREASHPLDLYNDTHKLGAQTMPQLIYTETRQPVKTGDVVHLRGKPYTVTGTAEPHKPASTGRVYVQAMDEGRMTAEYFPNVIGAEWINRTDR